MKWFFLYQPDILPTFMPYGQKNPGVAQKNLPELKAEPKYLLYPCFLFATASLFTSISSSRLVV
jgi:hypothetical protein